ncbi:ABC transporter permease [Rhodococcus sp. RD6.2]|jgi:peptide/nickel transport system permease protein|uniref:ABC transporter permease n=1 Tax=Rhodococcus sp. RD6.2 TaxID=260936 RepID=UPI00063BC68B|nr:ABC transporter permease [Rhodococcus sp. RD6.2]CRK52496.1 ABC transporter permease [Rhodococcus sp. RD6.2]
MVRYLVHRVPSAVAVLVLASLLIFFVLRLVPGDPATTLAGPDASPEAIAAVRHSLGLDRSIPAQYAAWLGDMVTFDLGRSYVLGGQIADLVGDALLNTVVLTAAALLLAVVVSLVLSVAVVVWPTRWLTGVVAAFNTLAVALPTFVTGVLLVLVFAVLLPLLPAGGVPPDGFLARPDISVQYLALPTVCLGLPVAAALTRFLTEALRTEMRQPYILTARALGVSRWNLVTRSALRNALPTMLTILGLQTGQLLGGAVLVEAIFAWPGIGQLIEQGISRRDYPVVQVLLLIAVSVFVIVQLVTDVVHAYLDPRIRIGGSS